LNLKYAPAMRIFTLFVSLLFAANVHANPAVSGDDLDKFLADKGLLAQIDQVRQSVSEKASELVVTAMGFLGVPYRRGGNTVESGFRL
jgi:cell wall-associated NlpC family hydrolase